MARVFGLIVLNVDRFVAVGLQEKANFLRNAKGTDGRECVIPTLAARNAMEPNAYEAIE